VRSLAACEKLDPSKVIALAEATPRVKIDGITIPADTTSMPSRNIALRESFIVQPPVFQFN
jgi:hypothetical protein